MRHESQSPTRAALFSLLTTHPFRRSQYFSAPTCFRPSYAAYQISSIQFDQIAFIDKKRPPKPFIFRAMRTPSKECASG
jgi:hypothetical protein